MSSRIMEYCKFLSPPLRPLCLGMLDELKRRFAGKRRGSSTRYYCLGRISGVNNDEKGTFVPELLF